jgi:hypothetical protein
MHESTVNVASRSQSAYSVCIAWSVRLVRHGFLICDKGNLAAALQIVQTWLNAVYFFFKGK